MSLNKLNTTDKVIIALAMIALVFSFTTRFDFTYTRLLGGFWNFGHVVAFYIWTYLCLRFIKPLQSLSFPKQCFVILSSALIFGIFIEFIQMMVGRDAQIDDIISDLSGSALAILFHSNKKQQLNPKIKSLSILLIITCALFLHKKIILYPINDYYTYQNFPVLIEPSLPFESTKFKTKKIHTLKKIKNDNDEYFKVIFSKAEYSTIFMGFFPLDWHGYDQLEMRLVNPGEQILMLRCRVHDLPHLDNKYDYEDRFSKAIEIKPGENIISISIDEIANAPKSRKMDLTKMAAIGLFMADAEEKHELHIYNAKLIKNN